MGWLIFFQQVDNMGMIRHITFYHFKIGVYNMGNSFGVSVGTSAGDTYYTVIVRK
jgi:hypothetical protein